MSNRAYKAELTEYPESFPIYVSQHIGDVKVGEWGMAPVRAMLDVVGRHAENMFPGDRSEYHATIMGQGFTVVVALEPEPDV